MKINQVFPDEYRVSNRHKNLCGTALFVGGVSEYLCECKNPKQCKGVIRTSIDTDIEAGKIFDRRAYVLRGECGPYEYYDQFVNDQILAYVEGTIGFDRIVNSKDPHFNDIPLRLWDNISPSVMGMTNRELWKACNNSTSGEESKDKFLISISDGVCVAKKAAAMLRKANGIPGRYTVKVFFKDTNYTITTEINGTPESIREYYAFGRRFNVGGPNGQEDRMETVREVRFI